MLIHPLGIVLSKLFNRSGQHSKNNPFGKLAMESTILLFVGLFLSYSIYQIKPEWFFPIMLLTIGSRYLVFQSIYGLKIFWILGSILILLGFLSIMMKVNFYLPAIFGGLIEIAFGIGALISEKKINRILI